jgi:hypothetical protein
MLNRSLTKIIAVTLLAAVAGVLVGRFYAGAVANTASAEGGTAETVPNAPTWKDLHVVYFGPAGGKVADREFDPANFASEINATAVTSADEVLKYSQTQGLDVLVFDKQVLAALDPSWAASQYRRGTAFVGLNVTSQELGKLVGDPGFVEGFDYPAYPEPFLSYAMLRIEGDTEHIKQLEERGALYPYSEEGNKIRNEFGFTDVNIGWVYAYTNLPKEGLIYELSNILNNSVGKAKVAPSQP